MLPEEFAVFQPFNVALCSFDLPHIRSWLLYLFYKTLKEDLNAHMVACTSWDIFITLTQFERLTF